MTEEKRYYVYLDDDSCRRATWEIRDQIGFMLKDGDYHPSDWHWVESFEYDDEALANAKCDELNNWWDNVTKEQLGLDLREALDEKESEINHSKQLEKIATEMIPLVVRLYEEHISGQPDMTIHADIEKAFNWYLPKSILEKDKAINDLAWKLGLPIRSHTIKAMLTVKNP